MVETGEERRGRGGSLTLAKLRIPTLVLLARDPKRHAKRHS